jgi:tyrosine-protein kinase Etk/Wzc
MNPQLRTNNTLEGIDLDKLSVVIRNNWFWLLTVFMVINLSAILYVRYTKNMYESSSELKLDVTDNATDLVGIKSVVEDPNINLISGEIEIIQSKLFLQQVLHAAPIDISYFSRGRVLDEELFGSGPFHVRYKIKNSAIYNRPVFIDVDKDQFTLRIGEDGREITGRFNQRIVLPDVELTLLKNDAFNKGDEVGYFFTINSDDVLLKYLVQNLTAEPINFNANTIRIAFKDHNARKAQKILQKIDTLYLEYSNEQKNLANSQKIQWLSNELSLIEDKMEGIEDYFENFTLQNRSKDLDQDLSRIVSQVTSLDSQRYLMNEKLVRIRSLQNDLETNNYMVSMANRQYLPPAISHNLDELYSLILDQEKLKLVYREATFAYREQEKEIENLKAITIAQLSGLQKETQLRLKELTGRKEALEKEFTGIPDKNTEFTKNMRFYKLNEQLYLTLMQSKSEFEVLQAGSTPDFKILSPASFPVTPISPKKSLILGAGLVISLVIMVIFIGLMYLVNNKITSLTELENSIALPVLGVVPTSPYIKEDGKSMGLFAIDHPKSMVSEALRTIRTNLDFFNLEASTRVIAISSTVSGEGKSFIAMNLGAMIALSTKKVILLDLDMRKNKSQLPLDGGDPGIGVSTVLIRKSKWQDCVVKTQLGNFDYLPSGPHPPNPSELLLNPEFQELLEQLKKHYDYILLDTPPVGLLTDGIMAMKQADLSIYIFRASYSKRIFISNLQRLIAINKFSNMTMVLNALPLHAENKYGYGYYEEWERTNRWKQFFKF